MINGRGWPIIVTNDLVTKVDENICEDRPLFDNNWMYQFLSELSVIVVFIHCIQFPTYSQISNGFKFFAIKN